MCRSTGGRIWVGAFMVPLQDPEVNTLMGRGGREAPVTPGHELYTRVCGAYGRRGADASGVSGVESVRVTIGCIWNGREV
jgi:hypothetical protein